MAKQYKVLVNTGKEENNKAVDVQQFSGDKGQPVRIQAQAGAKYQLQEVARGKNVGPDYVKAKRVGKDLHILFEDETQASLIIEDYYDEKPTPPWWPLTAPTAPTSPWPTSRPTVTPKSKPA